MKYPILAGLLAGIVATSAVQAQELPPEIAEAGVVRIGLELPYVPMEWRDATTGELMGFDIDLAKALAETLGVEVEYVEGAFETLTPSLQTRRTDIIMSGFYDRPARREYFDFVNYLVAGGQMFASASRDDLVELTDLCGKIISTVRATSYPDTIKAFSRR
jgi:polar amino acid transport system substrate-binding protein